MGLGLRLKLGVPYEYVKKGVAPYVEWLGQKETPEGKPRKKTQKENPEGLGWATGEKYGYDIVKMIRDLKK